MREKTTSKTAFIVKDSKSYVDAEETWYRFTGRKKNSLLFIVIPKGSADNQKNLKKEELNEVLDEDKWEEIVWVETKSNNLTRSLKVRMQKNRLIRCLIRHREFLYNLMDRIHLDRIAQKYKPCPIVVSGHKNTQEHLAAALDPETLYLVDAGLSVLTRFEKSGYVDYSHWYKKNKLSTRRLFLHLTGLKLFDREKTTLFTAYADQINTKHHIEKNRQEYKKVLIQNKKIGDTALWISSPIHEMVQGVELKAYVDYMKASLELLAYDGSDLIYIPHAKKESSEDIAFIEHEIGCSVDGRILPVEVKVVHYQTLPGVCISPLSSALINLDVLSDRKMRMYSAWHYEFNCFEFWVNWRKEVENNPGLNIQFLDVKQCPPLFGIHTAGQDCKDKPIYKKFQDWELSNK